jgi:glycosyltransferase involved in cell wall biosynthesis
MQEITNNTTPRVSVGMPVYNGENFIEAALDSILNQTFKDFELLISDNASTDRTEEICRSYSAKDNRIQYYRNETNLGAAYNFNHVVNLSSGTYFMWAAHDDMYAPDFLLKSVKILDQKPAVVLCFSKTTFIDEEGRFLKNNTYWPDISSQDASRRFYHLVVGQYIVTEIFGLIRSTILKKTGLIGNYAASDRVLLGELALYGPFYEIPEYLFYHREHSLRSAKIHRDLHSYMTWWAPKKANQIRFPNWKILFEQLMVIKKVPLNHIDKIKSYLQMVKWIYINKKEMMSDIISIKKCK